MSSHVVVIDKTARRHMIKVGPETLLNSVFLQACKKAGVADIANYGLRHGNRTLDLSLPFRFTKLAAGAKLELIQLPKGRDSVSEVTVALQMMDGNGSRLTHKFPSQTSIWSILRTFELNSKSLGVKGINITELAIPSGNSGSGRLFYSMPVVQIVNKELGTFDDLKQTLSSMGFNSGTALLRLKFKPTDIPLETALQEIATFSNSHSPLRSEVDSGYPAIASAQPIAAISESPATSSAPAIGDVEMKNVQSPPTSPELAGVTDSPLPPVESVGDRSANLDNEASRQQSETIPKAPASIAVFKPPQSSTPLAAKIDVNDSDFDLTISQAKQFQAHLAASARPQRLLSENELREKERISRETKEKIEEVEVKVRFPDQMILQATFKSVNTAEDLYVFVRSCLRFPEEPFYLYVAPPVRRISETSGRLVLDCAFTHRTLVNFSWDSEKVSKAASNQPALSDQHLQDARAIEVPRLVEEIEDEENKEAKKGRRNIMEGGSGSERSSGGGPKIPKWLKLPGKK